MRVIHTFLFCFMILAFISCKKKKTDIPSSTYISWKACSQTNYGNGAVKICFDSLLQDSRCPTGVICTWQGTAIAKFSFTVNNDQQDITLSVLHYPSLYPSDTTIMGYKIEFLDLQPYPKVDVTPNISDYKAEVKITKQ